MSGLLCIISGVYLLISSCIEEINKSVAGCIETAKKVFDLIYTILFE